MDHDNVRLRGMITTCTKKKKRPRKRRVEPHNAHLKGTPLAPLSLCPNKGPLGKWEKAGDWRWRLRSRSARAASAGGEGRERGTRGKALQAKHVRRPRLAESDGSAVEAEGGWWRGVERANGIRARDKSHSAKVG